MSDQTSMLDGTKSVSEGAGAPAASNRASRRTAAAKLLQAAALATVLVPLGSIKAEANPCTFSDSGTSNCATNAGGEGFTLFDFADPGYKVGLKFDEVHGQFGFEIVAHELTEAQALAKMVNFPGFRPVPIGTDDPAAPFIDFEIVGAPAPCFEVTLGDCDNATNTWVSRGDRGPAAQKGYDLRIYWSADTNALYPDPHVLHATGGSEFYDIDVSDGSYNTFVPCDIFNTCGNEFLKVGDPAVGGRDDMFTTFGLGDDSQVPEPASLLLLGSGISGLLYRHRRRK